MGCFQPSLGIKYALHAEWISDMLAMEIAYSKGWHNLWLECDSNLVVHAFHSLSVGPWKLRTRWLNCLKLVSSMNFHCTHIYRKGNMCADKLATHGISCNAFV